MCVRCTFQQSSDPWKAGWLTLDSRCGSGAATCACAVRHWIAELAEHVHRVVRERQDLQVAAATVDSPSGIVTQREMDQAITALTKKPRRHDHAEGTVDGHEGSRKVSAV